MAVVRKRKLRKAMMEDVMVVDIATWHRLGEEQRKKDLQIEGLTEALADADTEKDQRIKELEESNSALVKQLVHENKNVGVLEQKVVELKGDNGYLDRLIKKLEEDVKFEKRRSADAMSAFDSVARAADSTSTVSSQLMRLFDSLDLSEMEIVVKPREEKKKR